MKDTRNRIRRNEMAAGPTQRSFFHILAACGALAAALGGAGASTAGAAVKTWVGGNAGGPTNWGVAGNWTGGLLPVSTADQAVFGSAGSTGAVDLGSANRTVGGFTFNSAVNTTITSNGVGQTLTTSSVDGECLLNVVGGSHVINAHVTGSGDLRLKGTGSLTFEKTVTAAALAIGSMEDANNPSYNGTVTFTGNVQTFGAIFGDINLNGASPLTLVIGGNLTDFGDIVLASGITVRATAGSHRLDETDVNGSNYISNVTFDGPGNLTVSNAAIDGPDGPAAQMTWTTNGTGKVVFEGLDEWQPGMGLIKAGSGAMEIQNTALYAGNTNVSAGTLLATRPAALSGYLAGQVSVASGATLAVRAGGAGEQWTAADIAGLVATGSFASGSSLGIEVNTGTFTSANNLGVTQAAKGLVKSGVGTLSLTDANTFTGNTRVTAGTLAVGNVNALQSSTLDMSGPGSVTFAVSGNQTYKLGGLKGNVLLNAGTNSLRVGANGESTVSTGGITAAALTKEGAGTLTLTGPQTYATFTASAGAGTTFVNTALGSGTTSVVANASIRFGVSQTLASLTIGTASLGDAAVVPEPGAFGLLLTGVLGSLAARRRRPLAG